MIDNSEYEHVIKPSTITKGGIFLDSYFMGNLRVGVDAEE